MGRSCAWCRRPVPTGPDVGRPRLYCRRSCRQRAYEARRRVTELTWGEEQVGELRRRIDDVHVGVESLADVVDEFDSDMPESDSDVLIRLRRSVDELRALVRP